MPQFITNAWVLLHKYLAQNWCNFISASCYYAMKSRRTVMFNSLSQDTHKSEKTYCVYERSEIPSTSPRHFGSSDSSPEQETCCYTVNISERKWLTVQESITDHMTVTWISLHNINPVSFYYYLPAVLSYWVIHMRSTQQEWE